MAAAGGHQRNRVVALLRRAGWGVADQALSSLTNFGLSAIVARAVGAAGLGSFTLVFATYVTTLGVSRAIASEPLLVHYSAGPDATWRVGSRRASGAALLIGLTLGLGCVVWGWWFRASLGLPFLALGLTLPGLLVQDCWRFVFFARGRGASAFANDLVAALVLLPIAVLLLRSTDTSVTWLAVLAWGGGATIAAIAGGFQAGVVPAPHQVLSWWREERTLIPRFLGEFMAMGGANQIVVYALGAMAGLAALGEFRAAYLVFGPIQVLYMGVSAIAVPELVRALHVSRSRLLWTSRLLSLMLMSIVILWGALVLAVPVRFGIAVLGSVWPAVRPLAIAVTAGWLGTAVIAGAASGLRAMAAAKQSLGVRVLGSAIMVSGGVLGAWLRGASGAIWGLALGGWLEALLWWWQYTRTLRTESSAAPVARLAAHPRGPAALLHDN